MSRMWYVVFHMHLSCLERQVHFEYNSTYMVAIDQWKEEGYDIRN
jgi:hypothetical protein